MEDNTYIVWMVSKNVEGRGVDNWIIADVVFSIEDAFASVHKYLSYKSSVPCIFKIALHDDIAWKDHFNYNLTKLKKVVK